MSEVIAVAAKAAFLVVSLLMIEQSVKDMVRSFRKGSADASGSAR